MRKIKQQTCTSVVFETLVRADDFMTAAQLLTRVNCTSNQISAALIHLRKRKAVDVIEQPDALWWYATPDTDDRSYVVNERTPETRARIRRTGYTRRKKEQA